MDALKPLSDPAFERSVIGCVLLDPRLFPAVAEIIQPADFIDPLFAFVFETMQSLYRERKPIDKRFILAQIKNTQHADAATGLVVGLLNERIVVGNWNHYAKKLAELSKRRRLVFLAEDLAAAAKSGNPDAVLAQLSSQGRIRERRDTNLLDATMKFAELTTAPGSETLIDLGIPELDYALAGGVEPGEFVIFAGRPSHGKSAIALQIVHHWSSQGIPALFISEEMSANALAKRTIQYATDVPQEHWRTTKQKVFKQTVEHFAGKAATHISESCKTADYACDQIMRHVKDHGVRAVVVDYVQLLSAPGKTRYEQITNTSVALRQVINETHVTLIGLCQLSREIERRESFEPKMSDLKETGQLEQDADVIVFGVWPHRVDKERPPHEYTFYVAKNRNRAINKRVIECRFEPSRQRFSEKRPQDQENYEPAFDAWA